jgi:hypothetical protein
MLYIQYYIVQYIFRQCTYIVYEYIAISGKEMFRCRQLHFIIRCITVERYKESSGITRGLPIVKWVRVARFLFFCVVFCRLLLVSWVVVCPFVLLLLAIVFSVLLLFTDSNYPFGIFELF